MIHENISEKRVKISAQNPDFKLPQLFIIQVFFNSIFNLGRILLNIYVIHEQTFSSNFNAR